MSSGSFTTTKYELDNGTVVPFRAQPETLLFTSGGTANDEPAGAVTLSLFAKANKGTREYGIGTRRITISWEGSPPTDYADENLNISIMQSSVFDGYNVGDTATYLGTTCTIVAKKAEQLR